LPLKITRKNWDSKKRQKLDRNTENGQAEHPIFFYT